MAHADRLTVESGVPILQLMETAGNAVATAVIDQFGWGRPVSVLAGPGNNGGDAFVAARLLRERGCDVEIFAGTTDRYTGAAAASAQAWGSDVRLLRDFRTGPDTLIVDGLFGAGLSRPVDGEFARTVEIANASRAPILAIDIPSGIDGNTGEIRGAAMRAALTVTFFRPKPGHLLLPGRAHCGEIRIADIGISSDVLARIEPTTFANEPALWHARLLAPSDTHHKYDRGHTVVLSGGASHGGAARLSAMAALRGGAGLVTVASPASGLLVNATHLDAIMLKRCDEEGDLRALAEDRRLNAYVLGPGFGVGEKARASAGVILKAGRALVLDADGLTSFQDVQRALFEREGAGPLVLTPHDGEFARLFPDLAGLPSKLDRARLASRRADAIVVLKGGDTVIAAPDGRAAINENGSPALATAGTGDVLTGLIAAQLANGVPAFEAACAAVWIHACAASGFGTGLIAEDLPRLVPRVLATLHQER
nr:NAD(P)H-hydrate dehydratase [Aureimonas populi]